LILADGDVGGVVEENVGGLQDGVGEEAEFEGIFVAGGGEWGGVVWEGELALGMVLVCLFG
jgi:hypothetical protein